MMRLLRTKQHLINGAAFTIGMLLTASAVALTTDHATAESHGADAATQRAMLDMQYADEQRCFIIAGDEVRPVMPLLVSSDGLPDVVHDHVLAALDDALVRGCDINQPDLLGLSPLNTAILQGNIALVRYLVEHGADPTLPISSAKNEEIDGLNSAGLLDILSKRAPDDEATWQQLREAVNGTDKVDLPDAN